MINERRRQGLPRTIEIGLAFLGLTAVAPVLAFFAILIRLNSRGPVLFRQQRVGQKGKIFVLFKLRTMAVSQTGPMITAADDRRVTSVGKILRRYKIDELPELWNVLIGEMSFVGPRPEVPEFVDLDDISWQDILSHRPGITDPVTLRLRNEEQLLAQVVDRERYYREVVQPYKKRGYVNFVRNKSWRTDIRIIGRTLKAIALPRTIKQPTREEMQWSLAD
ncbi:MAG: sugar transferase [Acidobacteria bacterium]|nr:sugar transferase [Acidobacteriota bacterium]